MRHIHVPIKGEPTLELVRLGTSKSEDFLRSVGLNKPVEKLGRPEIGLDLRYSKGTSLWATTLHTAFMGHYPLGIRPEVLMYLINHEVAQTVNKNPENYRALFTSQAEGKSTVRVRDDSLIQGGDCDWGRTIGLFDAALRKQVPPGIMDHMLPDFTTHTAETRAASLVCFMDTAKAFYDYRVQTLCGIPEIILFGETEDYRKIVTAASALSEQFSELRPYFANLLPVLKKIADQADPATPVDTAFWSSIYNWSSGSGTAAATGWHTNFYAYLRPNVRSQEFNLRTPDHLINTGFGQRHGGIEHGMLPCHVSSAPFIWEYLDTEIPMTFVGGLMAIDQTAGALTPGLSYAVLRG